jgi:glycosyltransferase involved in cell wall biosynthesis
MRILLTVDPEIPVPPITYGGIERIVDALVRELRRQGHHIGLAAHPASTTACDAFFPWAKQRSQNLSDTVHNARVLYRAAKSFDPDLIHSFSRLFYLLPVLSTPVPKVMSFQREPAARTVRIASAIARNSLSFTGCSEYICGQGRRGGGEWAAIHNFVDTDYYDFQETVPIDAPLMFLSRIEADKGAHTAIAVAQRVGRKLLIAGNRLDVGPANEYWKHKIQPNLGHGIEYVGPVNDEQKNKLLGRAAALIVPIEWNEPFGIVFAEALACGTPIISCPRGALPEIVRPGVEGFLVNSLDEACAAVSKLKSIDRTACRKRAEEEFSVRVIAKKYLRLYEARCSSSQL